MRVIVIGLGEVGQNIARTLSAERHDVTIVDRDEERVEAMRGDLDALLVAGNGASPKFLSEVGAGDADLLCAVTNQDEVNVIAALAARQLGTTQTVARVRDDDYFGSDESFSRDVLGIDLVIHPERATAEDLAASVLLPGAVHVEHFADGRVAVAEAVLTDRSPLIGQALKDRTMVRPHSIVGLIRDGRTLAAEPGQRPKKGDHVIVTAARDDIGRTIAHLAGHTTEIRNVVIFGGGRIGLPLAQQLQDAGPYRVTVMEQDADRARLVAERLGGVTVLHEDGMGTEALLAHGIDRADAFIACAGDDRSNLLASLHAKQVGAGLCLAVISREDFVPLVDALGIDGAFSPRLVTAETILRAVRGGTVHAMHLLLGGAEVLEVQAEPGCRAATRTVEETQAIAYAEVAAIVRDGQVLIPKRRDRIEPADRVVLFTPRRGLADVRRAFECR